MGITTKKFALTATFGLKNMDKTAKADGGSTQHLESRI